MFKFIARRRTAIAGAALAAATLVGTATVSLAGYASASDQQSVAAQLDGSFTLQTCPVGTPAADACWTDHITATLPVLGNVTGLFELHMAYSVFAADGCGPIDKSGAFTAADGSTLQVRATGLFCGNQGIAAYDYRITGGTGKAKGASGSGTWLVPPPNTFTGTSGTGAEFFHGTLSLGD